VAWWGGMEGSFVALFFAKREEAGHFVSSSFFCFGFKSLHCAYMLPAPRKEKLSPPLWWPIVFKAKRRRRHVALLLSWLIRPPVCVER